MKDKSLNKFNRIDAYINASQAQKNRELHKIYGEWRLPNNKNVHGCAIKRKKRSNKNIKEFDNN